MKKLYVEDYVRFQKKRPLLSHFEKLLLVLFVLYFLSLAIGMHIVVSSLCSSATPLNTPVAGSSAILN